MRSMLTTIGHTATATALGTDDVTSLDEARVEGVFRKVGLEGECWRVTHEVVNRKLDVRITRSFVQGRFEKKAAA